jgi:cell division protein FtsB
MNRTNKIQRIKKMLLDPYLISTVSFATWMLFFDYQNVFSQYRLYKSLQKLNEDRVYYSTHIKQIRKEKKELLHNDDLLEKFAREKYYMKREKEDLYIVIEK